MAPIIEKTDSIEVILKITERCNIDCTYCYMFNKGNEDFRFRPAAIASAWIDDVVDFLVTGIADLGVQRVNVVLHGGEPLMLKKPKFREICSKLRSALDELVQLEIGLQTNGILIDAEWIDLFSEFRIALGISLDGPAAIHDLYRVDKRGRGTHAGTVAGMALLAEAYNAGRIAKPGVICVINPRQPARPIYRHIVDELKIDTISFNLPMETNDTIAAGDESSLANFLVELFDEWRRDDKPNIHIRLFDNMLRFFAGDEGLQSLLPNFITRHVMVVIASDGMLSEHDDFKVINFGQRAGTIRDTSLYEYANSPLRRYLDQVVKTVPQACGDCKWRGYCRAGVTHGLTVSRYSHAQGFDNKSSMCGAFTSLFEAGADFLTRHGLSPERLSQSLNADDLLPAETVPSVRAVPQSLFS